MLNLILKTPKEPAVVTLTQEQLRIVARAVTYYSNEIELGVSLGMDDAHKTSLHEIQTILKEAQNVPS